jgi:hypothetical protein
MVICIIALVVFSVLGLFSARWRQPAKEAFDCVFKMVQLKPCDTKFDERIKSKVTAKLMKFPTLARAFYKYFKVFSWIFVISFFASMGYTAYGIYNLIVYGTCDPSAQTCIISQAINCGIETLAIYITLAVLAMVLIYLIYKYIREKKGEKH